MRLPTITLQPGGVRPPNAPQKTNILAILGAAPLAHSHAIEGVDQLPEALATRITLLPSATAPSLSGLGLTSWWFNTTDDTVRVPLEGQWVVIATAGSSPNVTSSLTAPSDTSVLWFDPSDGSLSTWNGSVWVSSLPLSFIPAPGEEPETPVGAYVNTAGFAYVNNLGHFYISSS